MSKKEKNVGGRKAFFIAVPLAVVMLSILAGIGIYNMDSNRLHRYLDLGDKYLAEECYEEASIAFEQAIAIDERCMEAYVGGMEAYRHMGEEESLKALYDKALDVIRKLDAEDMAENLDDIVKIYRVSGSAYRDNLSIALTLLEEGYYLTGENEQILSYLGACLEQYINQLIEENRYDEVYALIAQYEDVVTDVDFQAILARMEEHRRKAESEEADRAFMQKVYELMAAEDYEGMYVLYHSEEASEFCERLPEPENLNEDLYIYFPDENNLSQNGLGVGVNKSGENVVYYYGEYTGMRNGHGVSFGLALNYDYQIYTGEWQWGMPSGWGEMKFVSLAEMVRIEIESNFVNGLCDGEVDCKYIDSWYSYDLSFTAQLGRPVEDKSREYMAFRVWSPEYLQMIENLLAAGGGDYIYAYGFADNPEHNAPPDYSAFAYYHGEPIGAPGFGTGMRIY